MTNIVPIPTLTKRSFNVEKYPNCKYYILKGKRDSAESNNCIGETEYKTIKQYLKQNKFTIDTDYTETTDINNITTINIQRPDVTLNHQPSMRMWKFFGKKESNDAKIRNDFMFKINPITQRIKT